MTEPEGEQAPELTFDEGLETGYDLGTQDAQEELTAEVEDYLSDQGFDDDDIIEALYDPASKRRHRRKSKHSKRSRKMYDPAAKKRKHRRGRRGHRMYDAVPVKRYRRAKGALGALGKYAGVLVGAGKFLLDYNTRAKALGVNPTTTKPYTIIEAIQHDINTFDSNAAFTRLQTNFVPIAAEVVGGMVLRSPMVDRKLKLKGWGKVAGDILLGIGVETALKTALDPPVTQYRAPVQQPAMVQAPMPQPAQIMAPAPVQPRVAAPAPVQQPAMVDTTTYYRPVQQPAMVDTTTYYPGRY